MAILDDFAPLADFAAEIEKSPRTVARYIAMPDGLPVVKVGNTQMLHIPTAREWLLSRMRRPNQRRGKAAA